MRAGQPVHSHQAVSQSQSSVSRPVLSPRLLHQSAVLQLSELGFCPEIKITSLASGQAWDQAVTKDKGQYTSQSHSYRRTFHNRKWAMIENIGCQIIK